ncbi:MAG: hypothetical protein PF505_05125 [Vallitaleaceae bacterium]|jgi:Icc-related predicted phosphoesterase|nr:hypothetical protein [Vallitaleaceae bacterium]
MENIGDKLKIEALYIATLPERTIRSAVSATMGVSSLATTLLLPKFIKESTTYRVSFGMLQQFLIQKIAEVEQEEKAYEVKDKYVIRKTAGSFIEGIGLVSIRFSPVWMLAIISDVSGGSKAYLNRLVNDMKKQKLIDDNYEYTTLSDLLDGISGLSKLGVDSIDMPPITKDEFAEFKRNLSVSLNGNMNQTKLMMKDLETVWNKMHQVGKKENLSISKMNGAMTLDLMKQATIRGMDMTKSTVMTTYDLFNELIIKSYMDSIDDVVKNGRKKYLMDHMAPVIKQFSKLYKKEHVTVTEKVIKFFGKSDK